MRIARACARACRLIPLLQVSRWGDIPTWHGIDYGLTRLNMSSVNFFCMTLRESLESKQ